MTWEDVVAYAAGLPGAEITTYYNAPAVKANGRPTVTPGREEGSFCLHIDRDTVEMLKETDPVTFWQSAHYEGWPSVLVRYASEDTDRVFAMIARAHEQALVSKPPRPRQGK